MQYCIATDRYLERIMKFIRLASWALTIIGILCIAGSQIFNLSLTWLLTGIFLAWAGMVKIVVVLIWSRVARLGTDDYVQEEAT